MFPDTRPCRLPSRSVLSSHLSFSARAPLGCGAAFALALALAAPALAGGSDPGSSVPAGEAGHQDPRGFLYGRIETRYESWEGRLRWDEEGFWDQYLDASKVDLPLAAAVPLEHRFRTRRTKVLGAEVEKKVLRRQGRQVRIRFGDLAAIEPRNREWSTLVLRDGRRLEARNGGDIRGEVTVWVKAGAEKGETAPLAAAAEASPSETSTAETSASEAATAEATASEAPPSEKVEVSWSRIRRIVFLPTPEDLVTEERRIFGRAETTYGTFEGALQWDRDECTSTDLIDGEDAEGERHRVPLGEISYLEPADLDGRGGGTRVGLRNGGVLELDGTNDVDASNRGLWIHDARWGRVSVPWRHLRRLQLVPSATSGPAYGSFGLPRRLTGAVETRSGERHRGFLAYDVDEQESWEVLTGRLRDRAAVSDRGVASAGERSSRASAREGEGTEGKPAAEMDVSMEIGPPDLEVPGAGEAPSRPGDPEGADALALELLGVDWRHGLEVDLHFEHIEGIETLRLAADESGGSGGDEGEAAREVMASRVRLTNGEVLELGGSHDVDERHWGLVILPLSAGWAGTSRDAEELDLGGAVYVPWSEVARVTFEPAHEAASAGESEAESGYR